jgi:DNA repair ATPase RecN
MSHQLEVRDSILREATERVQAVEQRLTDLDQVDKRLSSLESLEQRLGTVEELERRLQSVETLPAHVQALGSGLGDDVARLATEASNRDYVLSEAAERIQALERRLAEVDSIEARIAPMESGLTRVDEIESRLRPVESALQNLEAVPEHLKAVENSLRQEMGAVVADATSRTLEEAAGRVGELERRLAPIEALAPHVPALRRVDDALGQFASLEGRLGPLEALAAHVQALRRDMRQQHDRMDETTRAVDAARGELEDRLKVVMAVAADFEALDQALERRLRLLEHRMGVAQVRPGTGSR